MNTQAFWDRILLRVVIQKKSSVLAGREGVSQPIAAVQVVNSLVRSAHKLVGKVFESRVQCLPDTVLPGALIKTASTNVNAHF